MLKIAIADDDKLLRSGIRKIIDDNITDYEIVVESSNGLNILKYLEAKPIDLLITDIKMPVIDGINLLKAIKENGFRMKTIVISGYSEYKFMRETMKNGALDYLLKPIDMNELVSLINRIKVEIEKEEINSGISKVLIEEMNSDDFFRGESFLYSLVKNADFISKFNVELSAGFSDTTYCMVGSIKSDGISSDSEREELLKYLHHYLYSEFCLTSFFEAGQLIVLFLFNYQTNDGIDRRVNQILASANKKLMEEKNRSVSMGCGSIVADISKLHYSYSQAIKTDSLLFYSGAASIVFYRDVSPESMNETDLNNLRNRILLFVKSEDFMNIKESMNHYFTICSDKFIKPKDVRQFCIVLYGNILSKLELHQKANDNVIDGMLRSSNVNTLQGFLMDELRKAFLEKNPFINAEKSVLEKAQDYIGSHYQENISLKDVANHVNLNPTYFSELFKKETGQKFVDYLIETRINRAKRILVSETGIFVNEVARMVGYMEPVSFNRAFKKLVGCTPISYRIRNR